MWLLPSLSTTRTLTTGAPILRPFSSIELHALFHRRDELTRDDAALDLVDELEAVVRTRLDIADHPAVLPRASGLLLVGVVEVDGAS